jgi:predicted short-subunit dehydrogenase-like oxidoreductase (DUF2520 family)
MNNQGGAPRALTVVGSGRAGGSIARAARAAGIEVQVVGRGFPASAVADRCVLLCVPDGAIAAACEQVAGTGASPATAGHVSGASTLEPLDAAGATEGVFSVHPLQTIPNAETDLRGAHAAVSGDSPDTVALAWSLAAALGMTPFPVADADRSAYHAAASIASNFLITLEEGAAGLLEKVAVENPREVLAPLIRRTLENWIEAGPDALTGPIARGDIGTVERHRDALAECDPELLEMYDVLAARTAALGADGGTR